MLNCFRGCLRPQKEKRTRLSQDYAPANEEKSTVIDESNGVSHGIASSSTNPGTQDAVLEEKDMGMNEEMSAVAAAELASATRPKERQFQVVRVPGVFTRGRWKCWDYRDEKPVEGENVLKFTDDKENDANGVAVIASSSTFSASTEPPLPSSHSPLREESSTIVVTSIAPAPPTPQHGTPSSLVEMPTPPYTAMTDVHISQQGDWLPTPPIHSQAPTVVPSGTTVTTTTTIIEEATSNTVAQQPATVTTQQSIPATAVVSADLPAVNTGGVSSTVSSVSPPSIGSSTSTGGGGVNGGTPTGEMTRSITEVGNQQDDEITSTPSMSNAAAIDNKIEQAMDLVKTHLTFAVREEVEILRTTIADLETKVTTLETQNAYLRRYVSPEVLANLPGMIQQHKMSLPATSSPNPALLQQAVSSSTPSSTVSPSLATVAASSNSPTVPPTTVGLCPATTSFANSLTTVVCPPSTNSTPR